MVLCFLCLQNSIALHVQECSDHAGKAQSGGQKLMTMTDCCKGHCMV